jgi:hypothetical protein
MLSPPGTSFPLGRLYTDSAPAASQALFRGDKSIRKAGCPMVRQRVGRILRDPRDLAE